MDVWQKEGVDAMHLTDYGEVWTAQKPVIDTAYLRFKEYTDPSVYKVLA